MKAKFYCTTCNNYVTHSVHHILSDDKPNKTDEELENLTHVEDYLCFGCGKHKVVTSRYRDLVNSVSVRKKVLPKARPL